MSSLLVSLLWPLPLRAPNTRDSPEKRLARTSWARIGCGDLFSQHQTTTRTMMEWQRETNMGNEENNKAISEKLPITRPQKSYHPNIRLLVAVKSSIQLLMCLFTIVPINHSNCFDHQQTFPLNNNSVSHHHYLHNHRSFGPPNQLPMIPLSQATPIGNPHVWALPQQQHLLHGGPNREAPLRASPSMPFHQMNPTVQRRNELQQPVFSPYQTYQLQPVRPAKLVAEYVANQGHRILKNLVNTTIADLVAQSTMKMNANKLNAQLGGGVGPFPTMGKLYTLLFPTPSPLISIAPTLLTTKPAVMTNHQADQLEAPGGNGSETSPAQPILASDSSEMFVGEPQGREEKQQILSLSAPYDSQPRPSMSSGSLRSNRLRGLQQVGAESTLVDSNGDEWRRAPDTQGAGSSPDSNSMIFDHQQLESVGDEMAENGSMRTEMDSTDSLSSIEPFMGSHQRDMDTDTRKPLIIREAELYSSSQTVGEAVRQDQLYTEDQSGANYTPEADFSTPYGRARYIQAQESVDAGGSRGEGSLEGAEIIQLPRAQRQPKHYQPKQQQHNYRNPRSQHKMREPSRQQHHQQDPHELDFADQQITNETKSEIPTEQRISMSVHGNYATEEPSSTSEQPALKGVFSINNDSATSRPDDSYFTAHLPSQYDAVMRLPPEGYYDDYFKPGTAPGQASLHTANHEESVSSMSEFPSISTQPTTSRSSQNEDAVQYETVVEELPGSNYTSDKQTAATKKRHSVPSYKSQIITTEAQFGGHHNNNSYAYSQPAVGYTKQYYLNQQAMRQNDEPPSDGAKIEFIASNNKTFLSEDKGGLESMNYEIPSVYDKASQGNITLEPIPMNNEQHSTTNNTYQTMEPRNLTLQLSQHPFAAQMNPNSANEDSIKLIIANTISNPQDPQSIEKLINYTSDGYNITRGKSPRNNFINKDMNEFPPADLPVAQLPSNEQDSGSMNMGANAQGGPRGFMLQPVAVQHQQNPPQQAARQRQVAQQQMQLLPQFPRPAMSQRPVVVRPEPELTLTTEQPDPKDVATTQGAEEMVDAYSQYPMQRIVEPADGRSLSPMGVEVRNSPRQAIGPRLPTPEPHEQHHNEHHHHHVEQQEHQQPAQDKAETTNEEPDRTDEVEHHSKNRKQDQRREDRKRERRARQKGKFNKQHTMPRPQITQVAFNPKELNLRSPTPIPSASESPLETIAEIPHKVEQLRENQPDKNELMNELLTALDRVKVAIYKLQPLTAKMNAIYRKSVTSNTRNIVMDNHKGTYAKRYPPGDYDDSYDPMHPSERLNRQLTQTASQRSDDNTKQQQIDTEGNESVENAVYLPAPKEVLEMHKRDLNDASQPGVTNVELDSLSAVESKIVATGIGRRLGDGRVTGRLSLDSGERLTYDDEDTEETSVTNTTVARSMASFFPPLNHTIEEEEVQEPLFGYRITIYRSPEEEEAQPSEQYAYQVDGPELTDRDDDEDEPSESSGEAESMATSESSLVSSTQQPIASEEYGPIISIADPSATGDILDESESKGKKSAHKEDKKKSKKSQSKKKTNDEESKKKKEYKKIKHNKGLVSKEKKTMHRDKHIKAHDRGAAKEKALKERTQIEFFEREQIVDDEFEKGKKSTVKGGWQSGQDSKKSIKGESSGDTMSSGGSHFVKHEPKEGAHKVSAESSSAKKSNKFEKKQMEAKGKKFKGWREKGYKIITETEFIDRGSLHDSAYKKRDKGAAHHQKFKKQVASSEGHHGSLLEHHKKSNKKEEKKSNEKKEVNSKKTKKKPAKEEDHDHDESVIATTAEPDEEEGVGGGVEAVSHRKRNEYKRRGQQQQQPMLMSATSSTFRPIILKQIGESSHAKTLIRLLNSNVHDDQQAPNPIKAPRVDGYQMISSPTLNGGQDNLMMQQSNGSASQDRSNANILAKYHLLMNDTINQDTNRRSDLMSNSTILNIVDNLTGRQINKTKIGTYDLGDHHTIRVSNNNLTSATPLVKISSGLAKYFPFLSGQPPKPSSQSILDVQPTLAPFATTTTSTSSSTTTTMKPTQLEQIKSHNLQNLKQQFVPNYNLPQLNTYNTNLNKIQNQAHDNHQPQHQYPAQQKSSLSGLPTLAGPINPTTRPASFITPEQANAAVQILQLVQRANQVTQTATASANTNHRQNNNLLSIQQQQPQLNPSPGSIQRAAFIPPTMTNSYQPAVPIFPAQINFSSPPNSVPATIGVEQFLDYEHFPSK